LFKLFLALAVVSFCVLAVLGVAAEYWLRSTDITLALEKQILSLTGVKADFDEIKASLKGVLRAEGVRLALPDGMALEARSVDIRIDPLALLMLKVDIQRLAVDGLKVSYNEVAQKGKSKNNPDQGLSGSFTPQDETGWISFPGLPAQVNIRSAEARDVSVVYNASRARCDQRGVNISANGKVGYHGVEGRVHIYSSPKAAFSCEWADFSIQGAHNIDINIKSDGGYKTTAKSLFALDIISAKSPYGIKPGKMIVKMENFVSRNKGLDIYSTIDATVYGEPTMEMVSELQRKKTGWEYKARLDKFRFTADKMTMIPAFEDIRATGLVYFGPLEFHGVFAAEKSKSEHVVSGKGIARFLDYAFGDDVKGSEAVINFHVDGAGITGSKPGGKILAKVKLPSINAGDYSFENSNADIELKLIDTKVSRLYVSASVGQARKSGRIIDGAALNATMGPNPIMGDINWIKADVTLPGGSRATMFGSAEDFGRKKLRIDGDATVPFNLLRKPGNIKIITKEPVDIPMNIHFSVEGSAGPGWRDTNLEAKAKVSVHGVHGELENGDGRLDPTDITMDMATHVGPGFRLSGISANLEAASSGADIPGVGRVGRFTLDASMRATSALGGMIKTNINSDIDKITLYSKENGTFEPTQASFGLVGEFDIGKGIYDIGSASLNLGSLVSMEGSGSIEVGTRRFDIKMVSDRIDAGFLLAMIPPRLKKSIRINSAHGVLAGYLNGRGTWPEKYSDLSYPPGFDLETSIEFTDGGVSYDDGKIVTSDMDIDVQAALSKDSLSANVSAWAGQASVKDVFADSIIDPSLEFNIRLENRDTLYIDRFVFDISELGFVQWLSGSIGGLDPGNMKKHFENPAQALTGLDVDLENYIALSLEKSRRLFSDGLLSGSVEGVATIRSKPGAGVSVAGQGEFKGLSAQLGEKRLIEGLNGVFPFSKTIAYITAENENEEIINTRSGGSQGVRDTTFFEDLRGQSAHKENLSADFINIGPFSLSDAKFDLRFKENRFGVDYFKGTLAGGVITGSVRIKGEPEAYTMRMTEVFSGIDLAALLRRDLGLSRKESRVDGDITMEISLEPGQTKEEIDISRIEMAVHISRIGPKALDRILRFLDPQESSPSVMNARMALKYAKPVRVDLIARHGALTLSIDVEYDLLVGGQRVTMPVIKRLPIHSLVNFEAIRVYLRKLSSMTRVMRLVAASRLRVDNDGQMSLR